MTLTIFFILVFIVCDYSDADWDPLHLLPTSCSSLCFVNFRHELSLCDPKDTTTPSTKAYYDTKSEKCVHPPCHVSNSRFFGSMKECNDRCSTCKRVLKIYKPEDDCLKEVQVVASLTETAPKAKGPINRWTFDNGRGKCIPVDIFEEDMLTDWYAEGGLIFESQEECDKRCPSTLQLLADTILLKPLWDHILSKDSLSNKY